MKNIIEILGIIGTLLDFGTCIAILVLLILFTIQQNEYERIDSLIQQSLHQQPIAYFKVDDGTSTLKEKHTFFYWDGMLIRYSQGLQSTSTSLSGFNLTIWKNTTFISLNSTYYNYLTLLKQAKPYGEQCNEGYKPCGILDSFNQTLCLLENEICPLNQIELSNSSTPSDIFTNKNAVNITLLNDNKTYLHTSNAETTSPVMTEIVFGPESFCMNFEERKLGPPYYQYEYSSTEGICNEYAGSIINEHYISLDEYSKYNVYNENGIVTKIKDFLESFEESYPFEKIKDYKLHLYKSNYVGLNLTCLGDQELNEESFNVVKKYKKIIDDLIISVILILSFVVIFYFVGFPFGAGFNEESQFYMFIAGLCLSTIFIPLLSVSLGLFSSSFTNSIYKCAETPITEAFMKSETFSFKLMLISLSLHLFMVIIKVILILFARFKVCNKVDEWRKKQKEKKELAKLGFTKEESLAELKTY